MTITTIQQSTEVTEVGLVTISDIIEDETNEVWVREIKAFSAPDSGGSRTLLFTLRLAGTESSNVELNAPAQVF